MNKTDGAIQHCEVSREIMLRNSAMIENLDFKHLAFIEKHLNYDEKVSDDLFQIFITYCINKFAVDSTGVIDVFALRSPSKTT